MVSEGTYVGPALGKGSAPHPHFPLLKITAKMKLLRNSVKASSCLCHKPREVRHSVLKTSP